jgi:hypothetical protein
MARPIFDPPGADGMLRWHWEYWRGWQGAKGPARSLHRCEALIFPTAQAARELANLTPGLAGSDQWRPLPARPNGEFTRFLVRSPFMRADEDPDPAWTPADWDLAAPRPARVARGGIL